MAWSKKTELSTPSSAGRPVVKLPVRNLDNGARTEAGDFYRDLLVKHVLSPWFPRCVDERYGGFLFDFDRRWRPLGRGDKLLESQARQTLTAAEALMAFPSNPIFAEVVVVGFEFLRDAMWDHEYGGWFGQTDRQGCPTSSGIKHAHGIAYAIQACFAVYLATGKGRALDLAIAGFEWLDAHAHDPTHGGYFAQLRRDGTRITSSAIGNGLDHIGGPLGQKTLNVNKDLLSAFGDVCMNCPTLHRVRERFDELLEIMLQHFAQADSYPWSYRYPDWRPSSDVWHPSETAQLAGILIEVQPLSGLPDAVEDAAYRLLCRAYGQGWESDVGALVFKSHANKRKNSLDVHNLQWWGQFECLKAAEYLKVTRPDDGLIASIVSDARDSAVKFIDNRYPGITRSRIDVLSAVERIRRGEAWVEASRKGDQWKDASHDARCLLRLASLGRETE